MNRSYFEEKHKHRSVEYLVQRWTFEELQLTRNAFRDKFTLEASE